MGPSRNKGPHFWDEKHTADWWIDIYDDTAALAPTYARRRAPRTAPRAAESPLPRAFRSEGGKLLVGDASSGTLTYAGVGVRGERDTGGVRLPAVMAALQPDLPLVALLRDPGDRLYSAFWYYGHYTKKHGASAEGFDAYVAQQASAALPALRRRAAAADGARPRGRRSRRSRSARAGGTTRRRTARGSTTTPSSSW